MGFNFRVAKWVDGLESIPTDRLLAGKMAGRHARSALMSKEHGRSTFPPLTR